MTLPTNSAQKFARPKRRRMERFEILEISCVDNPAQAGAKAMIMKREEPPVTVFPTIFKSEVRKAEPTPEEPHMQKAQDDFDAKVEEIVARDKCSRLDATRKVREQHPALFAKLQSNPTPSTPVYKAAAVSTAVRKFDDRVDEIQERKQIDRTAALQMAAQLYPDEFEEFRQGPVSGSFVRRSTPARSE